MNAACRRALLITTCLAGAACTPLRPLDGSGLDAATTSRDATTNDAARDAPASDTREDARLDAPTPPIDAGPDAYRCRARCEGTMLVECMGDLEQRTACALGCVDTPPHCGELAPSNLPADSFASVVDVVVSGGFPSVDTTMCMGLPNLVMRRQRDDSAICVLEGRTVTLSEESVLFVRGTVPFAIAASGAVEINGTLYGASFSGTAGPGGGAGGVLDTPPSGPRPGARGMSVTSEDGGGGGGGACGGGGDGGRGGTTSGGPGGAGVSTMLEPLVGGSGGGAGGGVSGRAGAGGSGGGAIQITSLARITIRGGVLVGGGAGQLSDEGSAGQSGAGGGGGSGGSLLLEAPVVLVVPMTGRVLASGGGGAAGGTTSFTETAATDGVLAEGPAAGGMAGPSGGNGGASGGGATSDGLPGGDAPANGNGGGGGGGAGCIVLRTASATTTDALLSPSGTGLTVVPLHLR